MNLLCTDPKLQKGLFISGLSFYLYNELATMTIKQTGAVTSSVANTAKRVIVMVRKRCFRWALSAVGVV